MAIAVSQAFKDHLRGPIDRSQLLVEVLFAGSTWTNITDWVETASSVREESGASGGNPSSKLDLTLINDDGRFASKNANGPYYGNLTPNKPMRVSVFIPGESVRLGTFYSGAWPTQAKARTCQVQAQDAARLLLRKDIREETVFNPANLAAGYYLTPVLERAAWLSGLRWDAVATRTDLAGHAWAFTSHDGISIAVTKSTGAAVATYTLAGQLVMQLDLVDLLIPVAPLKGKALAVLDQLAKVVDGRVYFESQGQLVFRCPMYRNESTLVSVETFDVDNLDDLTTDQGFEGSRFAPLINRAEVTSTPYTFRLDAGGQVLEEEIPFKGDLFAKYHFAPGESYPASGDADLWCELPSGLQIAKSGSYPTAANVVLESALASDRTKRGAGIRFKDGFPVFEQGRMKVAFENVGSEAEVITSLTLKVRVMRPVQRCRGVTKNQASIDLYDQQDFTYNNDLIPHAAACKSLSAWKVESGRNPRFLLTMPVAHGAPWLEINDRITVSETITKTLPTAEDFIVKRISWRWTLTAFAFTIEACALSPNFSASAIPPSVAVVETSNQNMNGAEQGSLPPQVIDGTQALVGLNNIPSLADVVRKVKRISGLTPAIQYASGIAFDGSDIFVADFSTAGRSVYKINPMTGAQLASQQVDASSAQAGFICIGGDRVFVGDQLNNRVRSSDTATLGAFSTKGALTDHSPRGIIAAGGKLYCVGRHDVAGTLKLYRWDSLTATQKDNGDASYTLSTSSSDSQQIAFDGRFLWITVTDACKIAKFDTQTNAMSASEIDLGSGNKPLGVAHDGRFLWVSLAWGVIYRYQLTRDGSGNPAYVHDLTVAIDQSGTKNVSGLLFDGMYLWTVIQGEIIQVSTAGEVVARYSAGSANVGMSVFDGAAIWATGFDSGVYRVPRIVSGRQF